MEKFEKNMLYPALFIVKASGKEKKHCLVCNEKFKEDEKIVELYSSNFKGKTSYSNRFHRKCFLKAIAVNFPEILNEDYFDNEFKSQILISKVEEDEI
jgi:hypothetical protein